MIELPEAVTLAGQIGATLTGRRIGAVEVNHTPHGLTGFGGDPDGYPALLGGLTITGATAWGGLVEIAADEVRIVLGDGARPRLVAAGAERPAKHQLCLDLDDDASLVVSVQMYGGILAFRDGAEDDNPYYRAAVTKPSPLSEGFDAEHVTRLLAEPGVRGRSTKALLATEQRIPGLGNGTLQDILWNARLLPTRRVDTLSDTDLAALFDAVRATLRAMADAGGRASEPDLFGRPGGHAPVMGRATLELPCPRCGGRIVKKTYLGGAVYSCEGCQL